MAELSLKASKRAGLGKQKAKQMRKGGIIPAVVYGRQKETTPLEVNEKEFFKLAHGPHGASMRSVLIKLEIDGDAPENKMTLIKEIQHNALTGKVNHIDFNEVSLTEKIHARIPISVFGTAKGEKEGGIVDQTLRELEVSCLPTDIPEEIKLDISNLSLHASIHVKDINLGDKVEIVTHKDLSIVSIIVPRIVEEVVPEAAGAEQLVEPELVSKKGEKEEEEEEEGEEKEKK
jgi:large subunit ribosomal protein L25